MNYKFCIMAAGKGTRNTSIEGLHKALLPLENKTIISHIFDKIPKDVEIVIATGYKSEQIKSYLNLVHSDRKITYVDIENYDGEGSGPGWSLLCCESYLQSPFIFTSVDTIVEDNFGFENLKNNWIGVSEIKKSNSSIYCLVDGEKYLNKLYYGYGDKAFIGMAGIYDYKDFWKNLKIKNLIKNEYQVINGFTNLNKIEIKFFHWYDTGNDKSYLETRDKFYNDIVAFKKDEAIFIENNYVIKYFNNKKKIKDRLERIKYLNNVTPEIILLNDNMIYHKYIEGKTLSQIKDTNVLKKLIPYWYENLGKTKYTKTQKFIKNCKLMYHDKTFERCEYFQNKSIDNIEYVNGVKVDKIFNMLNKVNWNLIYEISIPSKFHGDLQPENIICDERNNFILIDWRESFGDDLNIGDFYYDLAKLYHALLINGKDVLDKMYRVEIIENKAFISNYTRSNLMFLYDELLNFCQENNYSIKNIELLSALQYLGISSLYRDFHQGEYCNFLFLYGKYLLQKFIQ